MKKQRPITLDQAYEHRNDLKHSVWYKLIYTFPDTDTIKIEFSAINDTVAKDLAKGFFERLQLGPTPVLHNGGSMKVICNKWT